MVHRKGFGWLEHFQCFELGAILIAMLLQLLSLTCKTESYVPHFDHDIVYTYCVCVCVQLQARMFYFSVLSFRRTGSFVKLEGR